VGGEGEDVDYGGCGCGGGGLVWGIYGDGEGEGTYVMWIRDAEGMLLVVVD
jgi:hypothetical protein